MADPGKQPLDLVLVKLLAIVTIVYVLLWAVVGSLLGPGFVALIATPLLAISLFIIASWDRARTSTDLPSLKQLLIVPQLNYWNILWVSLSIFATGSLLSLPILIYVNKRRPDFFLLAREDFGAWLSSVDWRIVTLFWVATLMSHTVGGFIAGWLPTKTRPTPYRDAVTGSIVYSVLNVILTVPLLVLILQFDYPSQQEAAVITLLGVTPAFSFSILGVWLALVTRTPEEPKSVKMRWSRRRLAILSVCMALVAFIGVMVWVGTIPGPVSCLDPPTTATLNCWPVSYASPIERCHEFPSIDAGLGHATAFSRNEEEWEHGLRAHVGAEIVARVYINNGAADNAEIINPGRGVARNVRLTTEIDQKPGAVHYVKVRFGGDNTNTVVNRFKITTGAVGRLEVVPKSGQMFNYQAKLIGKDFDVGNNTIMIGNLLPRFDASVFILFRLKVVSTNF